MTEIEEQKKDYLIINKLIVAKWCTDTFYLKVSDKDIEILLSELGLR